MTFTISLIILTAVLFGVTVGVLATLVIGIHSDDHAKSLTRAPRTHVQAATRLVLGVGVRYGQANYGGNEGRGPTNV